ncbi:MAG: septal ring lytic transglycosylase RlpA family protein, partial [Brevundimonas sp.]
TGLASWYGDAFNGRPTATGERFDMNALTAAHKTLPLPALVEVTNVENGRRVVLRVNDRGPFVDDRIIDLSRGAATELGLISRGVGRVRVRYVGPAPRIGGGARLQQASAEPTPPRPRQDQRFWVQAAAFASREAAALTASDLGQASVQSADVGGRPMFRVVMGPWSDANTAEQARQGVVARGFRDALLISGR